MFSFRGKNKYGSKKGDDTDVVKNEIFSDVKTVKLPKVGVARWTLGFKGVSDDFFEGITGLLLTQNFVSALLT